MANGVIILLQGEAAARGVLIGTKHGDVPAVEPLMDGTQRNHGVADGRFVVESLQHPSVPKSGDKEPRQAGNGPAAEEIKAPTLLLAP